MYVYNSVFTIYVNIYIYMLKHICLGIEMRFECFSYSNLYCSNIPYFCNLSSTWILSVCSPKCSFVGSLAVRITLKLNVISQRTKIIIPRSFWLFEFMNTTLQIFCLFEMLSLLLIDLYALNLNLKLVRI